MKASTKRKAARMSARRLVPVAAPEGISTLKAWRIAKLKAKSSRVIARYEAACQREGNLKFAVLQGTASKQELEQFQAGEFSSAEQAYENFLLKMSKKKPEIQEAVFGWDKN